MFLFLSDFLRAQIGKANSFDVAQSIPEQLHQEPEQLGRKPFKKRKQLSLDIRRSERLPGLNPFALKPLSSCL
jgi:hypothetical protein